MAETFFTSDLHFFHKNIIEFSPESRGHFANVEEMNEALVEAWNSTVGIGDVVWVLGDVTFKKKFDILYRLNGKINLIIGNHDQAFLRFEKFSKRFDLISHYKELSVNKRKIVLMHYPIESWNCKSHGSLHFHGHSHGTAERVANRFDVGVDSMINGLSPIPLDTLLSLGE